MLGARHANRDWQAKLPPHTAPDRTCNFVWWAEQMDATGNVGEGLVDRDPLDERREIVEHMMA